jgi:hypothetical protein
MGFSGSWTLYRCVIMAPGVLVFNPIAGSNSSDSKSKMPAPIDLTLVVNFVVPKSKDTKLNTKLVLEMSDEIVRIRFRSVQDLEEWSSAFRLWKEYAIDYGNYQQDGENQDLLASLDDLQIDMDIESYEGDEEEGKLSIAALMVNKTSSTERNPFHKSVNTQKSPAKPNLNIGRYNSPVENHIGNLNTFREKEECSSPYTGEFNFNKKPDEILEGWLEKKKSSRFSVGSDWQRRYARIDQKSRCFIYAKSPSMSHDVSAASSINLTMVSDIFNVDSKGKTNPSYVTLVGVGAGASNIQADDASDNDDEVVKNKGKTGKTGVKQKNIYFKASSPAEGEKWVRVLNEWRDYFLMQYTEQEGGKV